MTINEIIKKAIEGGMREDGGDIFKGKTPEEAVARLWFALNKKTA